MTEEHAGAPSLQIASYYDFNTERFLKYGGSTSVGAIHRQIWAPGVSNKQQALTYLNLQVAAEIEPLLGLHPGPMRVLDLGCGVGGTATFLAAKMDIEVHGITNSTIHHRMALQRATDLGLENRCRFVQADFTRYSEPGCFNAVYLIEALAHVKDPESLFNRISTQILPGGRLLVADDFLAKDFNHYPADSPANFWLQQFQLGWQINSLKTGSEIIDKAGMAGFRLVKSVDLTPSLRVLPGYLLEPTSWITRIPFKNMYWQNLLGGLALQQCIRKGWTKYHFLVWERE